MATGRCLDFLLALGGHLIREGIYSDLCLEIIWGPELKLEAGDFPKLITEHLVHKYIIKI